MSETTGQTWSQRNAWLSRLLIMAVCFVGAWFIIRLVGRINWSAVGQALGQLAWWQLLVLVGMLFVRQLLNALPLAFFIRGLGVYRAVVNDLASHLLAVAVPPPGDMVMRVGMFTSWGIEASRAIAGSLMNMLAFYITRFSVPILGFLLILPVRFDGGYAVTAALGAAVAGTIVALIVLGLRSEEFARRTGLYAGRLARKIKKNVDPDAWAASIVQFRLDMQDTFAAGFPRSAVGLVCLVLSDATILLLSLRFVGVSAGEVPAIEIYAAFLCVYPLTMFPFMGLGIADAVLLATIVEVGGDQLEPSAVAALVVWRSFTLIGPVLLGAGSLAVWRRSVKKQTGASPALPTGRA
ncbi:lysylphosphatidylglycerol synthase domain-containing protein [Nocardioides sp.]|uniref:lysylphosphatidylglycerol synthase domain-containing protein n=1 Tax=Nocardioides sp. TaxID=35761 RepID=UPI003D0FF7CF